MAAKFIGYLDVIGLYSSQVPNSVIYSIRG